MPLKVIISGASSGLGMALAKHYATLGATLGLIARNKESLEALAKELPSAFFYDVDVRNAQSMQSAARDFIQRYGCPDIVIANAGISRGTLTEYAEDGVGKDKYYLQAGSFQNAEDAENLKAKIAMLGMQAYVQSADLSEKGMWHRVRIGPFTKIVDINQTRSSLLKSGIDANLIKVHGGTQ